MGQIVFATIIENIKSFFVREDELLAKPKTAPESASEVFERPGAPRPTQPRIVEKPLPSDAKPTTSQHLPFSPQQLRSALAKQSPMPPPTAPGPPTQQRIAIPDIEEQDITHEIDAFETILQDAHREVTKPKGTPIPTQANAITTAACRATPAPEARESAFDVLDRFLLEEGADGEGILDKDILHRLREYHKHQRDGKQYYFRSRDAKAAVARKVAELKLLEREWLGTRDELDDLEQGMTAIEQEIEARARELRDLLSQARSATRIEKTAPQGQEFLLRDGRRLGSLLDLRIALRTMPEDVFRHHVNGAHNDFAAWTRAALGEAAIADDISRIADRHELAAYLNKSG